MSENPEGPSNIQNENPFEGPVQREDYQAVIDRYKMAFPRENG
ncbi:hypothetical protein [Methylocystis sp. MJC1]|nr:hypothetical protein [Methylocystis sp. MJC1]